MYKLKLIIKYSTFSLVTYTMWCVKSYVVYYTKENFCYYNWSYFSIVYGKLKSHAFIDVNIELVSRRSARSKMLLLKIWSYFLFGSLAFASTPKFPNCVLSLKFEKVCHFYKFDNVCTPWNTTLCQKLRTTRNEFKCPKYKCVSWLSLTCSLRRINHTNYHFSW